ncbi:MAG: c-type cytochrome, partial [Opitutaceae bacterium]
ELFTKLLAPPAPGMAARFAADIFRRHPQPWQPALLLAILGKAPATDTELIYAVRLALKTHALDADVATLQQWAAANANAAAQVADLALAVPTPDAAHFLLAHLKSAKANEPRLGDYARQVALQLPAAEFASFGSLLKPLEAAPAAARLLAAEGLALIAARKGRTLPDDVAAWMRRELFAQLDGKAAESVRAANALKPLNLPEKAAALRRRAQSANAPEAARAAALRALAPDSPETEAAAIAVLTSTTLPAVRRAAAELLGTANASAEARAALAGAFATAPADLALTLAIALAKSDAGAADLLDLATVGRVRPALLKHRYVVTALEKRPAALRERIAALAQSLPPEDARLDAVIAQRLGAAGSNRPDAARGAPLFAQHCAACHRFRDTGGNLGPSLDGIGSRPLPRLVEDILDPSRNIDPTFRLTTVMLKNGETKSGMNQRDEGDSISLTDPATAQTSSLAKSDIATTAISPVSPMPAAFETVLSEKDFFDLLEFLRSPVK